MSTWATVIGVERTEAGAFVAHLSDGGTVTLDATRLRVPAAVRAAVKQQTGAANIRLPVPDDGWAAIATEVTRSGVWTISGSAWIAPNSDGARGYEGRRG